MTEYDGDILVVVPCLNEARHLPDLLAALTGHACIRRQTIIVSDGGSTDGSQAIVQEWTRTHSNIHLHHNQATIQSAGINDAVTAYGVNCAFLVRVDAHADYPQDYVARLVETAVVTGADAVVVPMRTGASACFQTGAAAAQNSRLGTGGSAHRMGRGSGWVDHGHHALMRLGPFRALGGYDPRFSHNEDAEFDLRLVKSGGRIWMAADLGLGYVPRATPGALFRQYRNYGRGRARTVRLHGQPLKLRQALPVFILPAVLVAPLSMAALEWWPAALLASPAAMWAGLCILGGFTLALSARSLCVLTSGPAAMLMHLGWSLGFWQEHLAPRLEPRPQLPRRDPALTDPPA